MADEPMVPEPKDDDPDEVADKLSIAMAMWARGDRSDALSWVRRAAESASDAELDMRALEIAKAASDLAAALEPIGENAPTQTSAPAVADPAPPQPGSRPPGPVVPTASPTAARPPTRPPAAPPVQRSATQAPAAAARPRNTQAPPKSAPGAATKSVTTAPRAPSLPGSRVPGGKLPPLPPMRPLGSAPEAAPTPKSSSQRMPSIITSASGVNNAVGMSSSASGTIDRESEPQAPSPSMPWDDDEPTHQVSLRDGDVHLHQQEHQEMHDAEATAVYAATDLARLKSADRVASREPPPMPAAPVAAPAAAKPPSAAPAKPPSSAPQSVDARSTFEPEPLPLAVGIRVRVIARDGAVHVVADVGQSDGVGAIILPASADDDLRVLFGRLR